MFSQITKVIHQISYPKSCSTRQTVQCHSHGGPGLDGAVGHDGFQTPHPGVSISEVCNLGNNADQPQIPGWVCQDPDQARPGQAEGTTPASEGGPSRSTAGQIMGGSHGPPCATIHRSEILWKNGCQDNSLFDSQAENVQGDYHLWRLSSHFGAIHQRCATRWHSHTGSQRGRPQGDQCD